VGGLIMPLFKPVLFQGRGQSKRYFEGWYFKQVDRSGHAWSFIPGVSLSRDGSVKKSFVQAIDGSTGSTRWYEFPFSAFSSDPERFSVKVGDNHFSEAGLQLALDGPDGRISASLRFGPFLAFPARPWSPGIMGPYSFVPFMECRHGLVSLDHSVDGWLEVDGQRLDMDGGRGYIEKDWGRAMPSSWIWSQSNNFTEPGYSLMFSLANIPWLGGRFPGFLCAFRLSADPAVQIFATWNGSRIRSLQVNDTDIRLSIDRGSKCLELVLQRGRGGLLLAPVAGAMDRRIAESVDAVMQVRLLDAGRLIYEGSASPAGLEVVGAMSELSD